jgi:hypothetical protein
VQKGPLALFSWLNISMREIHIVERTDGTRINIEDWIKTKSPEIQADWLAANKRKKAIRQGLIDQGYMIIDEHSERKDYVWSKIVPSDFRPPNDQVWEDYFQQFLVETKQAFVIKFVDD